MRDDGKQLLDEQQRMQDQIDLATGKIEALMKDLS